MPIFSKISLADYTYRNSQIMRPTDYLLRSNERDRDPVFSENTTAKVGIDLAIGSDCGRIDVKSTLKASLKNLLDAQYFGDLGKDILAASPMLVTCYFSPTWCAILKHTKISANFLAQLRLDQCSLIDKYTDSRTEDFYQERQNCIHRSIERNGGNMEAAMKSCSNSHVFNYDLADWSGKSGNARTNKLIESSAKWAGFKSKEAINIVNLTKSLVGDIAVSKGKISVDYGPRKISLTPRTFYQSVIVDTKAELNKVIKKAESVARTRPPESVVKKSDLEKISGGSELLLIDRQTIRSLVFLPYKHQKIAVNKLSEAIALTRFTNQMSKTLDLLYIAEQNPHLPEKKKIELRQKRETLQSSVKLTMELNKQKNEPLNKVLRSINSMGEQWANKEKGNLVKSDFSNKSKYHIEQQYWDCADGVFCKER